MIQTEKQLKDLHCLLIIWIKYEYLTGEEPSTVEREKFEYSPLGMSLRKAFKKDVVKSATKSMSDFNYDINHAFFIFYKE